MEGITNIEFNALFARNSEEFVGCIELIFLNGDKKGVYFNGVSFSRVDENVFDFSLFENISNSFNEIDKEKNVNVNSIFEDELGDFILDLGKIGKMKIISLLNSTDDITQNIILENIDSSERGIRIF